MTDLDYVKVEQQPSYTLACLLGECDSAVSIDFFLFLFRFLVEFVKLDELYTVSM